MKRHLPTLLMLACAAVFVAGVVYLLLLRFEAGDVYPPYSSLRADPLGTMALAESLEELPGLNVRRDMSPSNKLPEEPRTTYLHLAADASDWQWLPAELFHEMEAFATRGARLVVTLRPVIGTFWWPSPTPTFPTTSTNTAATNAPPAPGTRKPGKRQTSPKTDPRLNLVSLQKRWGIEFVFEKLTADDSGVYKPVEVVNQTELPLPPRLDWHSALVLTNLDRAWQPIYARGSNAVIAERQFGRGSVVIATDSYFLSNEALWKAREPGLLAWCIGSGTHVVFDEAHLGVTETSGIAVLMRRYRLTGLLGALVVLALLFIWKNSTSLVPPYPDARGADYIAGRDAQAGFVNLLRRNIAPGEILDVCFEEWTKSLLQRRNVRIASVDAAQTIMEAERARPPATRTPVTAYRKICAAMKPAALGPSKSAIRNPQSEIQPPTTA